MTIADFITKLFCRIDDQMKDTGRVQSRFDIIGTSKLDRNITTCLMEEDPYGV